MEIKSRIQMIHHHDELFQRIKDFWGTGINRSKQARRLVDGDIDLDRDKEAIQALAMVVNLQIALDEAVNLQIDDE